MIPAGLIDGAFHQTQAMARTIGVNLTTAIAERQLPADTPAQMIARCQTCAFPEVCTVWLAESRERDGQAPDFCPNGKVLNALAARMAPA